MSRTGYDIQSFLPAPLATNGANNITIGPVPDITSMEIKSNAPAASQTTPFIRISQASGNIVICPNGSTGRVFLCQDQGQGVVVGNDVSPDASAFFQAASTTRGALLPRMTTTQKNAISSPAEGLIVYDTTLHKLCVRAAAAWEVITSV